MLTRKISPAAFFLGIAATLAVAAALLVPFYTKANPPYAYTPCNPTAAATTTLTYMTAGTATTTLTCDMFANGGDNNFPQKTYLVVYYNASSTASTLNMNFEFSTDGTAGSWYADALTQYATTSATVAVGQARTYSYSYASTTPKGQAAATSNTGARVIEVEVPSRYVRVFFTVPVGSLNGAVWAGFTAKKEQR